MTKKLALSSLSLALLGLAGTAHAQSSVTLYGVVDDSLTWVSNSGGKNLYSLAGDMLNSNRFGLKGKEDLGGGLSAIFQLEAGFNLNNGTSSKVNGTSTLFSRQAIVGLSSTSFGTLTLGRQYDALTDQVQGLTGDQWGVLFSTPGDVDNNDNGTRVSNTVKYVSPTVNGFTLDVAYGLGGVAGQTGSGQSWSAAIGYANGPLSAGAGYAAFDNASTNGTRTAWTSSVSIPALGSAFGNVYAGYQTYSKVGIAGAAVQYNVGAFTGSLYYSNAQYRADGATPAAFNFGNATFNTGSVLLQYQLTPALLLGADYAYMHANLGSNPNGSGSYNQFSLGAQYGLSKRTTLFAMGAYQRSPKHTGSSVGDAGYTSLARSQGIVSIGLDHKF